MNHIFLFSVHICPGQDSVAEASEQITVNDGGIRGPGRLLVDIARIEEKVMFTESMCHCK